MNRSRSRPRARLADLATHGILAVSAGVALFPVAWIVLMSLKAPLDAFALPPKILFLPTLESYRVLLLSGPQALAVDPLASLRNSAIVSVLSTALSIGAAALAGYALARFRFRGRSLIAVGILATRMLPPIATIIPLFLLMLQARLLDTHLGLALAYTALNVPFATWMLRGFIEEIPVEVEEAAAVDGCSRLQALGRVVLPLVAPGLAATTIYAFLLAWNDFALALMLTSRNAKTLPLIVMSFISEEGVQWGPMAAAVVLILLPPLILVTVVQRHLAHGLTLGAVRG